MNKTRRNVIIFVLAVLGSGWLGILTDRLLNQQPDANGQTLGMGIWLVLPLLAALFLRAFMGDGWRDMGIYPRLKGNLKWYVFSFLLFPAVTLVVVIIGYLTNWIDLGVMNIKVYLTIVVGQLLLQFVKNIFEESVWRGYLTSKLLKFKLSDFQLYFMTGAVWGMWHLPYYLIFLPEASIYNVLPVNRITFAIIAVITMMIWSIMYTEIFLITKSFWPLVIVHMAEDAVVNPLLLNGFITVVPGREILISPVIGIITTLCYLMIGLWLRNYRRKRQ